MTEKARFVLATAEPAVKRGHAMACEIGTIREIHRRLNSEGYHVSEHALRLWVKQGIVPAVYAGNKALISYERVLELFSIFPDPIGA